MNSFHFDKYPPRHDFGFKTNTILHRSILNFLQPLMAEATVVNEMNTDIDRETIDP